MGWITKNVFVPDDHSCEKDLPATNSAGSGSIFSCDTCGVFWMLRYNQYLYGCEWVVMPKQPN